MKKNINTTRLIAITGFVCLFLTACSSTGTVQTTREKTSAIPPKSTVSLNVQSSTNIKSDEVAQRLQDSLYGSLVSQGVFSKVVSTKQTADYKLRVNIKSVTEVSQGARIMLGVLAGKNKVIAGVNLTQRGSKMPISTFEVTGESASHPMSSENGIEDAVREMTTRIVTELK